MDELSSCLEVTEFQLEHISSQQRKYSAKTYNIDWEDVKAGKAAGMPGGWVSCKFLCNYTVIFLLFCLSTPSYMYRYINRTIHDYLKLIFKDYLSIKIAMMYT